MILLPLFAQACGARNLPGETGVPEPSASTGRVNEASVGENAGTAETVSDAAETEPSSETVDAGEALLAQLMGKTLNYPLKGADFGYALKGLKDVRITGAVTGAYSINDTAERYGISGTDLGIPFDNGREVFIAFGDTFSQSGMTGDWRSNVLAVTSDLDASDGILFDRMILDRVVKTRAKEIIPSRKRDNLEMTTIPTGGFSVGDTLYLCYMSVRHWGPPGQWDCNYGGLAKSTDNGMSWEKLEEPQWDGAGNFVQLCPVRIGEYVYFYGIGGGRTGKVCLMRAPVERVESKDAYEYLTDLPENGDPVYETDSEADAYTVINRPAGELSVMYNEYIGEWLITYLCGEDLIVRSAKTPEGPFSALHYIAKQSDFPGLYGAFMHPSFTEEGGRVVYFLMSLWDPVYNTVLVRAELMR